jgi:hypothetical protein
VGESGSFRIDDGTSGRGAYRLYAYCITVLRLSEGGAAASGKTKREVERLVAAYNRIEVARMARRFPPLLDKLADGSLNLGTARAPRASPERENGQQLLGEEKPALRWNRLSSIAARCATRCVIAPRSPRARDLVAASSSVSVRWDGITILMGHSYPLAVTMGPKRGARYGAQHQYFDKLIKYSSRDESPYICERRRCAASTRLRGHSVRLRAAT